MNSRSENASSVSESRARVFRFLLVGVLNTVFGYGVYGVLLRCGLALEWSLLLSTVLGVLFNFFTNGGLVFKQLGPRLFPRFVLAYVIVWLLMVPVVRWLSSLGPGGPILAVYPHTLALFATRRALDEWVGGVLAMPLSVVLTYVLLSKLVFNRRDP